MNGKVLSSAALAVTAIGLASACGGSNNLGSQVKPDAPTAQQALQQDTELQCKQGSYAEPLIIDLPADQRVDLEARMNAGVAIVKYDCNKMTLLKDCSLEGKYAFAGVSMKEQVISLENQDELRANLPFSGGAVGGELETGSQLNLALIMIGKRSTAAKVARPVLEGSQCGDATHFVRAATVGAFAMKTGQKGRVAAAVELFGAGTSGESSSEESRTNKDGDVSACKKSNPEDEKPPAQCQSAVKVELVPIADASAAKKDDKKKAKEVKPIENPCSAEGFVYVAGKCTPADKAEAAFLCDAKKSDECKAQCDKGHMGSCHNYAEAVFANFCNDPSKKAICDTTTTAQNLEREREAMKYWKKACDEGDVADACDEFGQYSLSSVGGMKADHAAGAKYLAKGCKLGNSDSCWVHGDNLLKGDHGVEKDTMKGLSLMDRACKLGEQYACQEMGGFYFKGKHLAKDPKRGYEYLDQFCKQGEWDTCLELSEHLLGIYDVYGKDLKGVTPVKEVPDADKIARDIMARTCAKSPKTDACARLGHVYYVEQKWDEARKYLPKGCKGDGDACLQMADMELNGKGGPKDKSSAVEFWLSSGDTAHVLKAAAALASGAGVPKDAERAAKAYASECGSDQKAACASVKRLDKDLWAKTIEDNCTSDDEWSCDQLRTIDKDRYAAAVEKMCGEDLEQGCKRMKAVDQDKAKALLEERCKKQKADATDDDKYACQYQKKLFGG